MADAEFRIQVVVEAVVACPESDHCHSFLSEALRGLEENSQNKLIID